MIAKRLALLLGGLLASALLLEVGARLSYRLQHGESFPAEALREQLAPMLDADLVLARAPSSNEPRGYVTNKTLHPYLGFVHDHSKAPRITNRFGFLGPDPLREPAPGVVRIAIAGGSVALQVHKEAGALLRKALRARPGWEDTPVELVSLSLGGYKQPQQLMALAWLLSLGAHFDVVVNLDGFNELTLPHYSKGSTAGRHPAFPRSWELYSQKALRAGQIERLARLHQIRTRRAYWRELLAEGWPASSALSLRIAAVIDRRLGAALALEDEALRAELGEGDDYQITGPREKFDSRSDFYERLAEIWRASSLQMHHLCSGNGIRYVHLLQPNQYVPGSKPLSGIERNRALKAGVHAAAVRIGYPMLLESGTALRAEGVAFHDLTQLFANERRTVYRDTCCHFNELGVGELSEAVAAAVAEALPSPASSAASPRGK